jgi:hypothetical protein
VLLALRDASAKAGPVVRAYRRFLVATYGNATETLADYALKPPKARAPRTSEQKAQAAAKLRATRKARATTSKKQKASIHGAFPAQAQAPQPPTAQPKPATGSARLPSLGAPYDGPKTGREGTPAPASTP